MTTIKYVVDTHTLIWYLENHPRLGINAGLILDDPASALFLPAIALAEAFWLVEHGRSRIAAVDDLLADIDDDPRMALLPLDRATLEIGNTLTTIPEMHDRQIVAATLLLARVGDPVALLTRDDSIRRSGLVPVVW